MRGKRVKRVVLEKRIHRVFFFHFDSLFFPSSTSAQVGTPPPHPPHPLLLCALVEKDIFKVKNLQDEVYLTKESVL